MNKLVSTLLAGAAALALSGGAVAAEEAARDSVKDPQNQTQAAPVHQDDKDVNTEGRDAGRDANEGQAAGTVNESGKDLTAEGRGPGPESNEAQAAGTVNESENDVTAEGRNPKKEEFQAELKKCDPMTGSQKQSCTDAAKKKHGQM